MILKARDKIQNVCVIDIGKTNAKLAMVNLATMSETSIVTTPNVVLPGPPYPHYDVEALWQFIMSGLRTFGADHVIDAISVTTHGAAGAILDAEGNLAGPILDYEHDGPDEIADAYDRLRPAFSETGSPRLAGGLNLGAQYFWLLNAFPQIAAKARWLMTYPQYWAYRLCGVMANEVTSLGTHTDLWDCKNHRFSSLVEKQNWLPMMAPIAKASDILGLLNPAIALECSLPAKIVVLCGIHDSNASLYPHLVSRTGQFSVVSTGTWVIAMSIGGKTVTLDPARDTLMNVNAFGNMVPSSRFMGGREMAMIMGGRQMQASDNDVNSVLKQQIMLLPAVENRNGPYQGLQHTWNTDEAAFSDGERFVAASYYLAMMTSICLTQIGADGPILLEGPIAKNRFYCAMLECAAQRPVLINDGETASTPTGTCLGTALLAKNGDLLQQQKNAALKSPELKLPNPLLTAHAAEWIAQAQHHIETSRP